MDFQLDIEKILEIYKQRVADLEHDLIILSVKCQQLEKELTKKNSNE